MGSGDQRLYDWFGKMRFTSYDEAYNWIYNNQGGKVYQAQYQALDSYFHIFEPLPFIELSSRPEPEPPNVLQQIQQGVPLQQIFNQEPLQQVQENVEPTEPSTNAIKRVFNALRGLFR